LTGPSQKTIIATLIFAGLVYMLPLQYFLPSPSLGSFYSMISADGGVNVERAQSYGPLARHKLDIYRPRKDAGRGPVVVFFYGGSWREGDRAIYGFVGAALAARGITTIIPDYRLYPQVMFPSFMEDTALAYGWVHDHIANNNALPLQKSRPIFVMGHSAGAHIAALLTLDQRYLHKVDESMAFPAGLIGLAGPMAFDPTTDKTTKEVFASTINHADRARPIAQVRADLPPVLLAHGQKDETVGLWNARQFAQVLEKAGAKTCKLEYADIGHVGLVLALSRPLRWRAPVLEATVKFIEEVTNNKFAPSRIGC